VGGMVAELAAAAADVVGAGDVAAACAPVEVGGAVGVPVLWQPPSSTALATAALHRTRGFQRVMPAPTQPQH
jgi:hypothetical protein